MEGKYEVTLMVGRARRGGEGKYDPRLYSRDRQPNALRRGHSDNQPRGSGLAKAVGGLLADCWRWTMRPSGRKWP